MSNGREYPLEIIELLIIALWIRLLCQNLHRPTNNVLLNSQQCVIGLVFYVVPGTSGNQW